MTAKTVTELRLQGGHPALDFANTVDSRHDPWGPDLLVTCGDLVRWAERVAVIDVSLARRLRRQADAAPEAAVAALARAKAVRELIYAIFRDESRGTMPELSVTDAFAALVQEAQAQRALVRGPHGFDWVWADGGLDTIRHRLVWEAATLLVERNGRRAVRECPGLRCGWLFLDRSRGGRRRWCADETCGTRSRVARFRDRGGKENAA